MAWKVQGQIKIYQEEIYILIYVGTIYESLESIRFGGGGGGGARMTKVVKSVI